MELWDLLNAQGEKTGKQIYRGEKLAPGDHHLIVDIWIRNGLGQYLISRRTPWKEPYAGLWEPTTGCVIAGEDSFQTALRETREELGLSLDPERGRKVLRFLMDSWPVFVDVWLFFQNFKLEEVTLQEEEVDGVKWADLAEIKKLQKEGLFFSEQRVFYLEQMEKSL